MSKGDSLEKIKEFEALRELIKKALMVWSEIFPCQGTIEEGLSMIEQGFYVVGNRYPVHSKTETYNPKEPYLSGVRLEYHSFRKGFSLYANDYNGDPAPLLIQLAEELKSKGIKIGYIQRQFSYDPPNPEVTDTAIKKFNELN